MKASIALVVLGLATLPAARVGLDAVADAASAGSVLLLGLALLAAIAAIGIAAISRIDWRWRAPAALAYAAAAGALAIVQPYDERTPGFVVSSILLFGCALRFATQSTGRQADGPRTTRGARAAATAGWVLAAVGLAAGVVFVLVFVTVLAAMAEGG